jgi:hypothetical protein
MRPALAFGAVLVVAAAAVRAAPDEAMPSPLDYAYGWPIEQQSTSGFHELDLPIEVYRSVTDPGLRDIGVYDARGEPAPRLISAPQEAEAPDQLVEKILLPLHATPGTRVADMRLALERNEGGTSVRIESMAAADTSIPPALIGYLTDLGERTTRLRAVELTWPREVEPVITQLVIEGSEDLNHWFPLGSGTIAGLEQDDARIERRRVDLESHPVRYLRLSWARAPEQWRLTGLVARYAQAARPAQRETETLRPTGRDPEDGGQLYDLGGAPAVDRIALDLAGGQDLVRAAIHAWDAAGGYWRPVHEGQFYRLQREGGTIESEPAATAPVRAAKWKVVIERGSQNADVGLQLGWRPDRLLFLAQGQGPWQLVAGSAYDAQADFPQVRRYADPEMRALLKKAGPVGGAALGARVELGGEARLVPAQSPAWRRWLLWLGLVAGVMLVGIMALRLLRQPPAPA